MEPPGETQMRIRPKGQWEQNTVAYIRSMNDTINDDWADGDVLPLLGDTVDFTAWERAKFDDGPFNAQHAEAALRFSRGQLRAIRADLEFTSKLSKDDDYHDVLDQDDQEPRTSSAAAAASPTVRTTQAFSKMPTAEAKAYFHKQRPDVSCTKSPQAFHVSGMIEPCNWYVIRRRDCWTQNHQPSVLCPGAWPRRSRWRPNRCWHGAVTGTQRCHTGNV